MSQELLTYIGQQLRVLESHARESATIHHRSDYILQQMEQRLKDAAPGSVGEEKIPQDTDLLRFTQEYKSAFRDGWVSAMRMVANVTDDEGGQIAQQAWGDYLYSILAHIAFGELYHWSLSREYTIPPPDREEYEAYKLAEELERAQIARSKEGA